MKKPFIFTIGHSTRQIDDFIDLLQACSVKVVADVRTIPRSRRNPQFNQEDLEKSLRKAHILYRHLKALGGLRRTTKDSVNLGWRNASFRGYADHMGTAEFSGGLEALMETAGVKVTAMMCAEAVPWRCHRSLIADALTTRGWAVRNIMSRTSVTEHRVTPFLKVRQGQLVYPEPGSEPAD